jgi:hypothetical protein
MKKVFIHHTALVDTDDIGAESVVWAYTHIMSGARIGKNCHISDHCFIESGVTVGDNTVIKSGNMLWEGITLEEGIFVGPLPQQKELARTYADQAWSLARGRSRYPRWSNCRNVFNGWSRGCGQQRCSTIWSGKGKSRQTKRVGVRVRPAYYLQK